MEICTMRISDYADVFDLWKNTAGMGLNTIDDSREGIEKYLKRNPETCFVAKDNNKIIGVILSGHDGRRGFLYHLAVDRTERKKGIGRRLVDAALEALKKEGITKVAFVVFKNNETGNAFWNAMGFEKREDLFYRNKTITDMVMKKIETQ